jgi:Flp pilus assembly protein TadG
VTIFRFRRRHEQPRTRGQALVEVALVLPIFLLLLMTLFDFGRVIYAQYTINQDAQEGVRKGIVSTGDLASSIDFTARFAAIRAAARVMAPAVPITDGSISGDPVACPSPLPSDSTVASTCFYPNGVVNTNPDTPPKVVVRIQVRVDFITPIISNLFGGGITVSARAEQLIQS